MASIKRLAGRAHAQRSGWDAPLTPAESVAAMRVLVDKFSMGMSGRFFRYDGTEIPW